MKKNLKLFINLFFITFFCFLLSSCANFSSSIKTNMIINEDGSGERVINLEINNINLKFKNTKYIDDLINSNCPKELEFNKQESLYNTTYTFDLKFSSMDDYKNKIKKLVNDNPSVEISQPSNIFTNGIELKENFTSKDLLDWCYNDLSLSNFLLKDSIWKNQNTYVNFKGNEYSTDQKINITKINYSPVDRIDILSNLTQDNQIQRTVNFYIPNETLEKLGDQINDSFKKLEIENCSYNITYNQCGEVVSVNFLAKNCEELSNFMNKILNSTACTSKINTENTYLFESQDVLNEYIDFSSFASNSNGNIFVNYELNTIGKSLVSAKRYQNGNWENLNNYLNQSTLKINQNMKNLNINISTGQKDEVTDIFIETKINDINKLQRSIKLDFSNEEILKKAKDYYENLKLENANIYTKDNECIIDLIGTADQINVAQRQVLGKNNNISILKQNKLSINNIVKFDDHIDIADFLNSIKYNSKVNYSLTSNLKIQSLFQSNSDSTNSINSKVNSNKLNTIIEENGVASLEVISNSLNQTFVINLIIILFIVFSVVLLLALFFIKKYFWNKTQDNLLDLDEKFQMSEYICPNCKMPVIIGMNYCVNCGIKLIENKN